MPAASGESRFFLLMGTIGGSYVLLILLLLLADIAYVSPGDFRAALGNPEIQAAISLTLKSCTVSAILSVIVGTALGYLLARFQFWGKHIVNTLVDIPIVLPPLVLGLSLLILFSRPLPGLGYSLDDWLRPRGLSITFTQWAVIVAQFSVAAAFAVRTMRVTFEQMNPRAEDVARTLGCTRSQAFLQVALPQAGPGMLTAFTIAWARSLGEFGPILVFAGATRGRTEVLSTSVFLELSIGHLEAAVAVSLLMVVLAVIVLSILRLTGGRTGG